MSGAEAGFTAESLRSMKLLNRAQQAIDLLIDFNTWWWQCKASVSVKHIFLKAHLIIWLPSLIRVSDASLLIPGYALIPLRAPMSMILATGLFIVRNSSVSASHRQKFFKRAIFLALSAIQEIMMEVFESYKMIFFLLPSHQNFQSYSSFSNKGERKLTGFKRGQNLPLLDTDATKALYRDFGGKK